MSWDQIEMKWAEMVIRVKPMEWERSAAEPARKPPPPPVPAFEQVKGAAT